MTDRPTAWVCAVCGESASSIVLLVPGEPDPRLGSGADGPVGVDTVFSEFDRVSITGAPISVTLSINRADVGPVASALAAGDAAALFAIDRELAPFWCPECAASYCGEHYGHWDVYDDGFFDCVRGVCHRGHERMLMD